MGRASIAKYLLAAMSTALIVSTARCAAADLPEDWQDRIKLGVRAYDRSENRVAFETFSKLMIEGARKFGAADGRMVRLYTNMGELYNAEGQYGYAEDCLRKGLNIAQKGYGENSVETVPALINLAQTYVHQGKDSKAKPLFDKALLIVDKPDADERLAALAAVIEADLGSMYYAQGSYNFGGTHFKRSLELAKKTFGESHKWTTTIGAMYAACLKAGGNSKEAKTIERWARAKVHESQSPFAIWNRQIGIADDAMAAKNYSEAETALKVALQAAHDLAAEPMLQAIALTRYGQLYVLQNKPAMAIEKWKTAQALADSALGPEDKSVLEHAKQLADLEISQNQYREAEPLCLRLVAHAKKEFGPDSDEYAKAVTDIAEMYSSWAQYTKAVSYYGKLLAWQEKKFGGDSEKLIPTLMALGTVAQNETRYLAEVNDKAEDHLKRASDLASKHFGKNSKEVANIWDALSRYYQRHFDWEKATKTCALVVAADEKNFGPDSAETVKALERYAVVLRAAGLRNEAEPVEARIAKIKGANKPAPDD